MQSAVAQLVKRKTGDRRVAGSGLTSHCVVSLSKTLYPLLSTGSTKEERKPSQHDSKIVNWHHNKQTNKQRVSIGHSLFLH